MSLSPATSSLHSRWVSLFLARLSVTIDALFILGGVGSASADRWFAMSGDAWLQTIYIAFHFARCAGLHKITNYSCTITLLQIVLVSSKNNESSISSNCVTFFRSGYIRIRIIILTYIFASNLMSTTQSLSSLLDSGSFFKRCRLSYNFPCTSFLIFSLRATLSCSTKEPEFFGKIGIWDRILLELLTLQTNKRFLVAFLWKIKVLP